MRLAWVALASVLPAVPAAADSLHVLAGYECDNTAQTLTLRYTGAFNDAGKWMVQNRSQRQWDPWSLVVIKSSMIKSMSTVARTCALADGIYNIAIGPLPGNANLQGMCGGHMSAWAEVKRGQETVLPRHIFDSPDCHDPAGTVTVEIIIEARKKPAIRTVSREEFYNSAQAASQPVRKK